MAVVTLLAILISLVVLNRAALYRDSSLDNHSAQRYQLWLREAWIMFTNINCTDEDSAVLREHCQRMTTRRQSDMKVYSAQAPQGSKLISVLPDESLSQVGDHDGVLALDPYPQMSWSHPVLIFIVKKESSFGCSYKQGRFISSTKDCVRLAQRNGCTLFHHNKQLRRHSHSLHSNASACIVDFLPSVFEVKSLTASEERARKIRSEEKQKNLLICRHAPGFAPCTVNRRTVTATQSGDVSCSSAMCLRKLSDALQIHCRIFEICNYAILIEGVWKESSNGGSFKSLKTALHNRTHFPQRNIRMFRAVGTFDSTEEATAETIYPTANKEVMRNYLRHVCQKPYCIGSLVIVLKGEAQADGSLLLWDANKNAIAEAEEVYRVEEIAEDLSKCQANKLTLIVATSNAGKLVDEIRFRSNDFLRTQVFTSSAADDFSNTQEFLNSWVRADLKRMCTTDIYASGKAVGMASPKSQQFLGKEAKAKATISGSPCGDRAPSNSHIGQKHSGCYNVPTIVWFANMRHKLN